MTLNYLFEIIQIMSSYHLKKLPCCVYRVRVIFLYKQDLFHVFYILIYFIYIDFVGQMAACVLFSHNVIQLSEQRHLSLQRSLFLSTVDVTVQRK